MGSRERAVDISKKWIVEFVIDRSLCPFASAGYFKDSIFFEYSDSLDLRAHLSQFWEVIQKMLDRNHPFISNSFLILDKNLSYDGILELKNICQEFLVEIKLDKEFRLVEFHPDLEFGDLPKEDPAHFINRSPLPMIHILRVDEVEDAISGHPNVDQVPLKNIEAMRKIGYDKLKKGLDLYKNMI